MGIAKHNKGFVSIDWGVDTQGYKFQKCSTQPFGEKLPIFGVFITPDAGYGEGAVCIMDGYLLNISERYIETIREIVQDPEAVAEIKAGKACITITEFTSKKYKKKGYDVQFGLLDS